MDFDRPILILPKIAYIFSIASEALIDYKDRIDRSLGGFVTVLLAAYENPVKTMDDIMMLDMLDNDTILINDADNRGYAWQCEITNRDMVVERMNNELPFGIVFNVLGLFKGGESCPTPRPKVTVAVNDTYQITVLKV